MKKGFTLVEMLIVVVVLVTLMSLVFRLSSIGNDSWRRNRTISRMQRLENCLSGYYAAFGSYPPVKIHGTRNIYAEANSHGIQSRSEENKNLWNWNSVGEKNERLAWNQVKAACRSQPVDASFPFPDRYSARIKSVSDMLRDKANSGDERYSEYWRDEDVKQTLSAGFDDASGSNIGRFNAYSDEAEWENLQLFKFGLMSYLLPRYLVMMNGDRSFFNNYSQWSDNNVLPRDPLDDSEMTWDDLCRYVLSDDATDRARVSNIPSQAVTARWMPNLEGVVSGEHKWDLYGIVVSSDDDNDRNVRADNPNVDVYEPGGFDRNSHSQQYVLDGVSVKDGWFNHLYYYSPAPYQSYVLWSSGPNGRTFPPWVPLDSSDLDAQARRCIGKWIEDDIVQMSN